MKYQLFRLSLIPRSQMSFLTDPDLSRYEVLKSIFSERHSFLYRKNIYEYTASNTQLDDSDILIGRIGRQITEIEYKSPEEGLDDYPSEKWRGAELFVNISNDADSGQIIAFEISDDVGKPFRILESFIAHIEQQNLSEPFDIFVAAMVVEAEFWNVIRLHSGKTLTQLAFYLFAPNILKASGTTQDLMKLYKEQANSENTDIVLNNPNGQLKAEAEAVEDLAAYALAGAGTVVAKSGNKVIFDSSNKAETIELDSKKEVLLLTVQDPQ